MQVSLSAYLASGRLIRAAEPMKIEEGPEAERRVSIGGAVAVAIDVSSLASRLASAASSFNAETASFSHNALGDKVRETIKTLNYPLTAENVAVKSLEVPGGNDPVALASAAAANDYVANPTGRNPFAGLSREQLSHIANDESGTFTTNERYAAYRQAHDEEQAWRSKAVADAMDEYHRTGKLTDFFSSALAHFHQLPRAEQALYPENYAADLREKVELDFNYFTHSPGGQPGAAGVSTEDLRSIISPDV